MSLVAREDRDSVAWLTLNRPEQLNALNRPPSPHVGTLQNSRSRPNRSTFPEVSQ